MAASRIIASVLLFTVCTCETSLATDLNKEPKYPNVVPPECTVGYHAVELGNPDDLISARGTVFLSDSVLCITDGAKSTVQLFKLERFNGKLRASPLRGWGEFGHGDGQFSCPTAVAVDGQGHVYVLDAGNQRIQVFDAHGAHKRTFGSRGHENGQLGTANSLFNPYGMAIFRDRLYLTDPGNHRVQVFDLTGKHLFSFGHKGSASGEFTYPSGITIDDTGNLFVADMYNHRIQAFTAEGRPVIAWGAFGSFPGDLAAPASITYSGGELFVADAVNHRIQIYSPRGEYLYQFGRHPDKSHVGEGRMHYPIGCAVSPSGDLVAVIEKFEGRCQVFDRKKIKTLYKDVRDTAWWEKYPFFHYRTSAQILKRPAPAPGAVTPFAAGADSASEWLVMSEEELHRVVMLDVTNNKRALSIGTFGSKEGELNLPQGAHLDLSGRLWVSDTLNDRLQIFTPEGKHIQTIGKAGNGAGEFSQPGELVIDETGTVYVLDAGNGRIQVLDKDGKFIRQISGPGKEEGKLNFPIGITLDQKNKLIYTVELYQPRVQSFTTAGEFRKAWGKHGMDPGDLVVPCHVATDLEGFVYVTDDALNRVTKFDPNGKVITAWGRFGNRPGEFYHPQGIAVDSKNRLWIIDYGNHRGQIFDTNGKYLGMFGEGVIGSDRATNLERR